MTALFASVSWQASLRHLQFAQIGVADQLGLAQFGGGAAQHDLAGLQDIGAVGDRERHVGVLLDHEDRDALLVDGPDDVEDLLDIGGREAHRWLVHTQQSKARPQNLPKIRLLR
jgi:hypothetical protein